MGLHKKTIGVLTSSRADYGIYLPLLKAIQDDHSFDLRILVFGTHLSGKFGETIKQIEDDGFIVCHKVETLSTGDTPFHISDSMAKTIVGFNQIWKESHFDLVFALGDRYEMFAAVASTVPFNIPVSHIHGGETTLGAIDNAFRHAITAMAKLHFTSTNKYKHRVLNIAGKGAKAYNAGALSIDSIKQTKLLTIEEFKEKYSINLSLPTILVTFHPETIEPEKNQLYVKELLKALSRLHRYQGVITMPNADTEGLMVRNEIEKWGLKRKNVFLVESFGTIGYYSCLKHCSFMLGNSSSGFVEASYFSKPVINIGKRQDGRIITPNILTSSIEENAIIEAVKRVENSDAIIVRQIYGRGNAASKILKIVKEEFKINQK